MIEAPIDKAPKQSETPRVDALDYGDQSIFLNGDGYGQLWELARTLEREAKQLRCKLNESLNLHNRNLTDTATAMQDDRRKGHHCDAHKVIGGVMDRSWVAIKIKA